ncbi:MAG: c-type cytochrome [Myxococcota bacterium]
MMDLELKRLWRPMGALARLRFWGPLGGLGGLLALLGLLFLADDDVVEHTDEQSQPATTAQLERGKLLAGLGSCVACHSSSEEGAAPLAGGHAIETSFGTFYGSNLTPDPVFGLGTWSEADFFRAMRYGRDPSGRRYYAAFPYAAFTGMTDEDLRALWLWLKSQKPVPKENLPHTVKGIYATELARAFWQWRSLEPGPIPVEKDKSPAWNLGRYLAETAGHCGECHTPRDGLGTLDASRAYEGTRYEPERRRAPSLTPERRSDWSDSDWVTFFETGMSSDGDVVAGHMREIVEEGTARLSAEERQALATYFAEGPKPR